MVELSVRAVSAAQEGHHRHPPSFSPGSVFHPPSQPLTQGRAVVEHALYAAPGPRGAHAAVSVAAYGAETLWEEEDTKVGRGGAGRWQTLS